ncbi:MAG TPA: RimK/LysX family protein [Candidatus Saccharimonadales bacterium]|nr:RimK/LysX family protein [Candidatus Saccharimonadales bacterium]
MSEHKTTIGRNVLITVSNTALPAKVDTGADSSSLWASDITEANGTLSFVLCAPGSSLYTGERITASDYSKVELSSSNGARSTRYVVNVPASVNNITLPKVRFTLADRSTMMYPALLGRKTLTGTFIVDVDQEIVGLHAKMHDEKVQRNAQISATLEKGI